MLIDAKPVQLQKLGEYSVQSAFRYFTVTEARLAIPHTMGERLGVFSQTRRTNKMDNAGHSFKVWISQNFDRAQVG